MHGFGVTEIEPHPFRRRDRSDTGSDAAGGEFLLRRPGDAVVVAPMAIVQVAAAGAEKFHGIEHFAARRILPHAYQVAMTGAERDNHADPLRHVTIAQPARAVLQVGLQMKDGIAKALMPGLGHFREALEKRVRLAGDQLGQEFGVQALEQRIDRRTESGSRAAKA